MRQSARAVVVGAGPAGLAAAHELHRRGIDTVILERNDTVGSTWRSRHEDLRLNTIRWLSGLPGTPIPRRYGRWVKRDEYVAYLTGYARRAGIPIEFGVEVRRIDREGILWRLESSGGTRVARDVIIASGPDRVPWSPTWPGAAEFQGRVRHVATVPRPREFAHQPLLVVGGGNSGVEWCEHLVRAGARRVWLSIRRPPNLLPREVHGLPLHPLAVALERLPMQLRDLNARLVRDLVIGDLASYGLPRPADGPYRRLAETGVTVAVDSGFSRYVRERRIEIVHQVERFAVDEVALADGRRLRPQTVLLATGYRTGLEPMVGHLGVLGPDGRPRVNPDGSSGSPGLWFIGFTPAIEGTLRRHGIEARRIAQAIAARWSADRPSRSQGALRTRSRPSPTASS